MEAPTDERSHPNRHHGPAARVAPRLARGHPSPRYPRAHARDRAAPHGRGTARHPAIAIHFVNNLAAILLVSLPDSLNGLALYLVPYDLSEGSGAQAWLMVDFAAVIVMWLTARVVLRR